MVSCFLAIFATIIMFFPGLNHIFEWKGHVMHSLEFYRVFTCHFTHFGFSHFFWDTIIFLPLAAITEINNRRLFMTFLLLQALLISMTNYYTVDSVYRGLSGTDTGLYALFLLKLSAKNEKLRKYIIILLILFFSKTIYEAVMQQTIFVTQNSSLFIPAYQAHLAGFLSGALIYFLYDSQNIQRTKQL